jgi:hypothetical protein
MLRNHVAQAAAALLQTQHMKHTAHADCASAQL